MTSTHLANLAKIRKLDPVPPSKELGLRMPETARVHLKDASITQISNEGRFESAYAAIRYPADIGLLLHGYRTSTSSPGHHQTSIGCLAHTLDVDARTISLLDGLRKQRNLADYDGDPVTAGALNECIRQASALIAQLEDRLRREGWPSGQAAGPRVFVALVGGTKSATGCKMQPAQAARRNRPTTCPVAGDWSMSSAQNCDISDRCQEDQMQPDLELAPDAGLECGRQDGCGSHPSWRPISRPGLEDVPHWSRQGELGRHRPGRPAVVESSSSRFSVPRTWPAAAWKPWPFFHQVLARKSSMAASRTAAAPVAGTVALSNAAGDRDALPILAAILRRSHFPSPAAVAASAVARLASCSGQPR